MFAACLTRGGGLQHKLTRKMVDNTKANTIIVLLLVICDIDVKEMAQSKHKIIKKG